VIAGPQGGYHVLVGLTFTGIRPPVTIEWTVTTRGTASATEIISARAQYDERSGLTEDGGVWTSRTQLLVFRDSAHVGQFLGRPVTLRTSVSARDSVLAATGEIDLVLSPSFH